MIVFKGLTSELTARLGRGEYQFRIGEKAVEESSQTAQRGFHCCENPFECLFYYPLGCNNRYFQVEAAGDINEDANERIACTELTLIRELTLRELAGYGMMYMVQHPMRDKWKQRGTGIEVAEETATAEAPDGIAIARGSHPMVKGTEGSILGLILEPSPGDIAAARLFTADGQQAGKWYTLRPDRTLQEVENEEEGD